MQEESNNIVLLAAIVELEVNDRLHTFLLVDALVILMHIKDHVG